jgi:hypothetical protein
MHVRSLPARRRAARPILEGLETRALLSHLPMSMSMPMVEVATRVAAHRVQPTISQLAKAHRTTVSTVPTNGDVNPYGVAFVPGGIASGGTLSAGDVLVSNFNASSNKQGTGTTITRVNSQGQASVFFQGPITTKTGTENIGLSTALGVLQKGFVVVGSVPSTDGTAGTLGQSRLLVLDTNGKLVNVTDPKGNVVNDLPDNGGPWDLAINDMGNTAQIFVSNVLTGTVDRFNVDLSSGFKITSQTQIASGYTHRSDPNAFELGPTGLAYNAATDTLYVASTADNAIFSIAGASTATDHGMGTTVYSDHKHLHGPLGLAFAPDGNLISAQGDAINAKKSMSSELVEFTTSGKFVGQFSISKNNPGGAFGVAATTGTTPLVAAVNDIDNTLEIWQVKT